MNRPNPFPLMTERLCLRAFGQADLPAFTAYRSHPDVARYQSWEACYTAEDARAFLADQQRLAFDTAGTWFQIAAERRSDGMLIGDVAVHVFDEGRQAELGVTFDLGAQGRGYAREATARIIALLFTGFGKHRIIAIVDVFNLPAQRLFERQGFRREAHWRENIFFKGKWSDEYGYALLEHEWQKIQSGSLYQAP